MQYTVQFNEVLLVMLFQELSSKFTSVSKN